MKLSIRSMMPAVILAALALCIVLSQRTTFAGSRNVQETADTMRFTFLDLKKILTELQESSQITARLRAMQQEIETHRAEKQKLIDRLREEMEGLNPGSDLYRTKQQEALMEAAHLRSWVTVKQDVMALEESLEYKRMYQKIVEAASDLAETRGYDLILLDDSNVEIQVGAPQETISQLFARRVIYRNARHDVTQDLIDRMNNQFNAQGGG